MKHIGYLLLVVVLAGQLSGCAPEVGSERWCKQMREKPKGEWSSNDLAAFTKHCVFQGTEK